MSALSLEESLRVLGEDSPSPDSLAEGFAVCFEEAQAASAIGALPRDATEFANLDTASPETRRALIDRLVRLGYLTSADATRPDALSTAVIHFQEESGLGVDGWVGAESWRALQELFTFESPFVATRWFDGDSPRPAVIRAVWLRLKAYGFGADTTAFNPAVVASLFSEWLRLATLLGVTAGGNADTRITRERCELLLNHDAVVARLAGNPQHVMPARFGADEAAVRHLLLCVMKVELWLSGYDLAPDGKATLTVVKTTRIGNVGALVSTEWPSDLSEMLVDYLRTTTPVNEPRIMIARKTKDADRDFDAALPNLLRAAAATSSEQSEGLSPFQLAAIIQTQPDQNDLWTRLKITFSQLTNSLFDGVKRVWRWLRRVIGKAVAWVGQQLVNLARAVWDYLAKAGRGVRAAFTAFCEGVDFFLHDKIPGSDHRQMVIGHDRDFDFRVFVAREGAEDLIHRQLTGLHRVISGWRIACKMLGIAIAAVRAAARVAAGGVAGLIVVIIGLLKVYEDLRELGVQLAEYMSLDYATASPA